MNFAWSKTVHLTALRFVSRSYRRFWTILFLIIPTMYVNFPYFSNVYFPVGDALYQAVSFFIFYNNFYFHRELAQWFPYFAYGSPAYYFQLESISASGYFFGLLGSLFHVKNILLVFKSALLFDQVLLLFGTYLLCRQLFENRWAVLFACIGILLTSIPLHHIESGFRFYFLLPLVFYFLILFFKKNDLGYLWLSGITFVISQLGESGYLGALQLLLAGIFFCALALKNYWVFTNLKWSQKSLILFLFFLALLAAYAYMAGNLFQGLQLFTSGRDANSGAVDIETFLNLGVIKSVTEIVKLFFGVFENSDSNSYVGIIPFVFLAYGFFNVRKVIFWTFCFIIFFLILFSFGQGMPVAKLLYLIYPPVRYFRYVGCVMNGPMRFFMLLSAGFGFDHFLSEIKKQEMIQNAGNGQRQILKYVLVVFALGVLFYEFCLKNNPFELKHGAYLFLLALSACLVFILARKTKLTTLRAGVLTLLIFTFDMVLHQSFVLALWHNKFPEIDPAVIRVQQYQFAQQRTMKDFVGYTSSGSYSPMDLMKLYNFPQNDFCFSAGATSYQPRGITNLFSSLFNVPPLPIFEVLIRNTKLTNHPNMPHFLTAIGCYYPKLRILYDVTFVDSEKEASRLAGLNFDFNEKMILQGVSHEIRKSWQSFDLKSVPLGKENVKFFSSNVLVAEVDLQNPDGAWLYYADSYHLGWRAYVNGKRVPIAEANLAFKAVKLEAGKNVVRFEFLNGLMGFASHLIAIFGVIFVAGMIVFMVQFLVWERCLGNSGGAHSDLRI